MPSGSTARSRARSTDPAQALGALLDHSFADPSLLLQALTHRSYVNEHPDARENEGLAFVGDAVLGLVVAEHLWSSAPSDSVGLLTPRRADIVSGASLARWAERIGLGAHLRIGRGEHLSGGRAKESLLATAVEAVLAVVYLEGGLPAARRVIARLAGW